MKDPFRKAKKNEALLLLIFGLFLLVLVLVCDAKKNAISETKKKYGITSATATTEEEKEVYISRLLRQGPFFSANISAKFLMKGWEKIGFYEANRRAEIALESLRQRGWTEHFWGLRSSTYNFFIVVDVTAKSFANGPKPVTVTRITIRGRKVTIAQREIKSCESFPAVSDYQKALGRAVEEVQIEALTGRKEIPTTGNCSSVKDELENILSNAESSGKGDTFSKMGVLKDRQR